MPLTAHAPTHARRARLIAAALITAAGLAACGQSGPAADKSAAGSAPGATPAGSTTVKVVDARLGMPAFSVAIPQGWLFDGAVLRDHFGPSAVLRTSTPDGLTGFQVLPTYNWVEPSPGMLRFYQAQKTKIMPPMSAEEFARKFVIPEARPGAIIIGPEPMPRAAKLVERDAQMNAQFEAQARGGRARHIKSDGSRLHIQYDFNGHPVDESIITVVTVADNPEPSGVTRLSSANVTAARAPRGKLAGIMDRMVAIGDSFTANPAWETAQTQYQLQTAQADQKHILDVAEGYRRRNQAVFEASMANTARMEAARHAGAVATADHMGDVQAMVNPATGETGKVSNQYNYSYVDQNGAVIHTDSATYNPNAELRGNWTQLQPLK